MARTILLAIVGCLSVQAATIVYSDFGPGQTYFLAGYGIDTAEQPEIGAAFIPSATGSLSQIDVPVSYFSAGSPPTHPLSIMISNDSGGLPGLSVLDSWTLPAGSVSGTPSIFSLLSTLHPSLNAGTQYWVVMSTTDFNGFAWYENSTGAMGWASNTGSGWTLSSGRKPAFDVIEGASAAVPEPSCAVMACLALAALGLRRAVLGRRTAQ